MPAQVRPTTPELDLEILNGFDITRQKVSNLIVNKDEILDLTVESKPVRDSLKASFGVSYIENVSDGGSVNLRLTGKSFYDFPGRNMRKEELEKKQKRERASKVAEFINSRMDERLATERAAYTNTSFSGLTPSMQ